MTASPAQSGYVAPECRVARQILWEEGHQQCPGPLELRERPTQRAFEVLRCSCRCHPSELGLPPGSMQTMSRTISSSAAAQAHAEAFPGVAGSFTLEQY